jgi:hypothetical protein
MYISSTVRYKQRTISRKRSEMVGTKNMMKRTKPMYRHSLSWQYLLHYPFSSTDSFTDKQLKAEVDTKSAKAIALLDPF